MTDSFSNRATTHVAKIVEATAKPSIRPFLTLTPSLVASAKQYGWRCATSWDERKGGRFKISLKYRNPEHSLRGKTSEDAATVQGRLAELIPYTEVVEFEPEQPRSAGEMKFIASFTDADRGTEVAILCEDIPKSTRPEDNEMGCKESLQKLAALLE